MGVPVIVMPCHNRKTITLECLRQIKALGILSKFGMIIVDDGSTDGTSEGVTQEFPEVIILHGNGNLFWTGAMELGMRHAIARGASCCVWLNDDLSLGDHAIEKVVSIALEQQAVVTGQGVINLEDGSQWFFPLMYRGISRLYSVDANPDCESLVKVDTCRGNLVAFPRIVTLEIGYPDGENIPHVGGDTDYGLRATAAGFPCYNLNSARFFEKDTIRDDNRSWLLGKQSLRKIWSRALARRGNLYPRMLLVYNYRHWGFRGLVTFSYAFFHLIGISLLRTIVPKTLLRRIFARKSHAYMAYEGRPDEVTH